MALLPNSDRRAWVDCSLNDSSQNEDKLSNACIGDTMVDRGSLACIGPYYQAATSSTMASGKKT